MWKAQLRSRRRSLDFGPMKSRFKLPTLAINEKTVLPQIQEGAVVLPHSKEEVQQPSWLCHSWLCHNYLCLHINLFQLRRKLIRCFKLVRLLTLIELKLKYYIRYDGYTKLQVSICCLIALVHLIMLQVSHSSGRVNDTLTFNKEFFLTHNRVSVWQHACIVLFFY